MSMAGLLGGPNHQQIAGVTSGIVTANEDPEGLGRVKLLLPSVSGDVETGWARVVTPMAGGGGGMVFVPAVGAEVLVAFEGGDVHSPYVLGSLWSPGGRPPFSKDGGKDICALRTRGGHMLLFDDSEGGCVTLSMSGGKTVTIDDDGIVIDDGANSIRLDANGKAMTIEAGTALTLKAPKIRIEAAARMELKGGQMLKAEATLVQIN
jgi:uncharacterized protein involved in type VI secretion and phage assembly